MQWLFGPHPQPFSPHPALSHEEREKILNLFFIIDCIAINNKISLDRFKKIK